jgi:hypothetical protein
VEPPRPNLSRRPAAGRRVLIPAFVRVPPPVRLAAAAGAAALALTSAGDALLLAALLGLVVADPLASCAPVVAAMAVIARIGTSSLPALAGAQSVLGPAILSGPFRMALSAAAAAAGLAFATTDDLAALPLGLAAAALVFGPGSDGAGHLAIRAVASIGAVALCAFIRRAVDGPARRGLAVGAALFALVLALPGHWSLAGIGGAHRWLVGGTRALAAAAFVLVAGAAWSVCATAGWVRPPQGAHRVRSPRHVRNSHPES